MPDNTTGSRTYGQSIGGKGDVGGSLQRLWQDCYIIIPKGSITTGDNNQDNYGDLKYQLKNLPEISEKKSANYNSQSVFGRASPIRSYSHSEARTISFKFDLYNPDEASRQENFKFIRAIASAVYPSYQTPYEPPPICKLKCGVLLSGSNANARAREIPEINCLLMSYDFSYGRDSVFDDGMMPFHIEVSLEFEVVYSSDSLPGREDVIKGNF